MCFKPRLSLRMLLAIIAAFGVSAWLARGWLYPNRMPGQHFALIGPMDIDRDGVDDRAWLRWMIHRNGGTIDYDLPVAGPASGAVNLRTTWYVIPDDPRRPWSGLPPPFQAQAIKVIKQARVDGIRPMPLRRLLVYLRGGLDGSPEAADLKRFVQDPTQNP
jgi:hypothetical protein